jgi:hypothetical protein
MVIFSHEPNLKAKQSFIAMKNNEETFISCGFRGAIVGHSSGFKKQYIL